MGALRFARFIAFLGVARKARYTAATKRRGISANGSGRENSVGWPLQPQMFAVPIRWFDATPFAPHRDMGHAYLDESFEVAADFYVSQTGIPLSLAQTNLTALPWLGGVESGNPIDWASAFASATCTIVKHLP